MDKREQMVKQGLEGARAQESRAKELKVKYEEALASAKEESLQLVEKARGNAQVEYDRTYNRLKQRKNRRKISVDEWNSAVARAQDLLRRSESGELSDEELKKQLETL